VPLQAFLDESEQRTLLPYYQITNTVETICLIPFSATEKQGRGFTLRPCYIPDSIKRYNGLVPIAR